MSTNLPTQILAISPAMRTEAGHFFTYHKSINAAADRINWNYSLAAPINSSIDPWPSHWHKCLHPITPTFKPRILGRLHGKYCAYRSLLSFLSNQAKTTHRNIVFLEYFSLRDLRMVMNCLLLKKPPAVELWLLFRDDPAQLGRVANSYRTRIQILQRWLGAERIRLLVDTDILAKRWSEFLEMPVTCTPIPLAPQKLPPPLDRPKEKTICWWPGTAAPQKGLNLIRQLLHSKDPNAQHLLLVAADTPALSFSSATTPFQKLPIPLPTQDYLRWTATSDIFLLPYDDEYYKTGSSGVFVETICHGKMPLVFPGTWMATELKQYNLHDLIVDWQRPDLPSLILKISQDESLKARLKVMQKAYRQYHSIESFGDVMLSLNRA